MPLYNFRFICTTPHVQSKLVRDAKEKIRKVICSKATAGKKGQNVCRRNSKFNLQVEGKLQRHETTFSRQHCVYILLNLSGYKVR